jgi:copper(I)-binding protein
MAARHWARSIYLACALALCAFLAPAQSADVTKGDIRIVQPWARATPGGAKVGAGYVTITNTGKTADRLLGGTAAVAGVFEIHDMTMTNGVMRMRKLDQGIELKPGATVTLRPGGLHLMFVDLKQPLKQGEKVKGTLVFEKAGRIEIEYDVAPIGASSPKGGTAKMEHHKHH